MLSNTKMSPVIFRILVGPACSDTALAVAGLATRYNYVMISYAVEAMVLSLDRNRYKYFFRTIPQINEYA